SRASPWKRASASATAPPGSTTIFNREKYGTKPSQELIAPALRFAKEGFTLEQGDAASFAGGAKRLAKDEEAAKIFLKPDGKPYA
ncbi:gamma-glutamyltransferase, partial [Rhizobium ruizarguesonis]